MTSTTTACTPSTFREVLGHYPTGVVIVTAIHPDGEPLAMVVGTFTAVSMEPPLVAFLPMKSSVTFTRLSQCESLCINVLTGEQETIGRAVSTRTAKKLDGIAWTLSPSGSPLLQDSLAWLDVRLEDKISAGDHWIALCRIENMAVNNPKAPLIFFQGGYGVFTVPPLLARNDSGIIEAVQQASRARGLLSSLATEHRCEATLLTIVHRDELAAIATAVGDEVNPEEGLGTRIPIIPPIADVWAAEQSADEQTYWLSKADADETVLDTYRKRLVFAREHGYVMSYLYAGQQDAYQSLQDATHRYADGATPPTAHREIRRTISNTAVNYTMCDIDPLHVYDVGMLAAAVRDPSGTPVRILRLAQLPRQASGSAVLAWINALRAAVAELERLLFSEPPAGTG